MSLPSEGREGWGVYAYEDATPLRFLLPSRRFATRREPHIFVPPRVADTERELLHSGGDTPPLRIILSKAVVGEGFPLPR